jgi:hypothetical protein
VREKKVLIRIHNRLIPVLIIMVFSAGCNSQATGKEEAAYFVPPTIAVTSTPVPVATIAGAATPEATSESGCSNLLAYIKDITVADGSIFSPGESIDKRWLVENQGTCNWNIRYSLRHSGGDPMSAVTVQSLAPVLAGSQSVLRIMFTAPLEPGKYRSAWQAYTPDSKPFGDPIFVVIEVISRVIPSPLP